MCIHVIGTWELSQSPMTNTIQRNKYSNKSSPNWGLLSQSSPIPLFGLMGVSSWLLHSYIGKSTRFSDEASVCDEFAVSLNVLISSVLKSDRAELSLLLLLLLLANVSQLSCCSAVLFWLETGCVACEREVNDEVSGVDILLLELKVI